MRRHVSSIVLSIGSPAIGPFAGPLRRYFMSQICCEIAATVAMSFLRIPSGRLCVPASFSANAVEQRCVKPGQRVVDEAGHTARQFCGVFVFHQILSTIEVNKPP